MGVPIQKCQIKEIVSQESIETKHTNDLKIVNAHLKFPKVRLQPPNESGYLLLALEVDDKAPLFITESNKKKEVLKKSKALLKTIQQIDYVHNTALFKARFIPPGRGGFIKKRANQVHIAQYDVVILIETTEYTDLDRLKKQIDVIQLEKLAIENSGHLHIATAKNIRRMGDVNHDKQGVFLFNFFYADNVAQNLKVWEYTAGWFQDQTGLDNSTLLRTQNDDKRLYSVINHCRWDKLSDILPFLIFKATFKTYVLANFEVNNTTPIPILYKLA